MPDPARAARARSGACVAPPPYCASAEQFWPAMLRFELFDGRACESTAKQKRILSCANLPVPLFAAGDAARGNGRARAGRVSARPMRAFGFGRLPTLQRSQHAMRRAPSGSGAA